MLKITLTPSGPKYVAQKKYLDWMANLVPFLEAVEEHVPDAAEHATQAMKSLDYVRQVLTEHSAAGMPRAQEAE